MHRITISLEGAVSVTESLEVADSEALPLFVQLKGVLEPSEGVPKKRRGRPPSVPPSAAEAGASRAADEVAP